MVIGLVFWCGLLAVLWGAMAGPGGTTPPAGRQYFTDLWGYYTSARRLELRLPQDCDLAVGDAVFAADANGALQQVGLVVRVPGAADSGVAQAVLFPSAPKLSSPIKAFYLSAPDSIEWVVQTLLPAERRKQVEDELAATLREQHQEILEALQPGVNRSVREALAVLEQDLPQALEKHRPELQALVDKDKEEVLKRELLPLVKAEVWPIIRKDSEPVVRQVSGELWERVSLWSFAWRGVADRLPGFRGKRRLEEELHRFLEQEAAPIFDRHEADFLAVIEVILRDVANNDNVKAALKRSAAKVAEDPALQQVLNEIFQDLVLKNPRLWHSVRQNLQSPEAQEALRRTGTHLEPTVRRLSDLVLGTRETGLTPEFSRVLRQQVLLKDRRGILVGDLPQAGPTLPCTPLVAWFSGREP
jgi:hypothetical protein